MILRIAILLAALLFAGGAEAAVQLRGNVVVTGPLVTLGDVLDGAGAVADVAITRAPEPGRRKAIGVSRILAVARANGLAWRPLGGLKRIIVQRASQRIPRADIERRLQQAIAEISPGVELRIELPSRIAEIHLATGLPATLDIENLNYVRRNGRFSATLVAAANTAGAVRTEISGRAFAVVEVPVLSRRVRRGDVIGENDVEWIEMRSDRLANTTILDSADLIGMAARRTLQPGKALRMTDVRRPVIVARGATVFVAYRTAQMSLTVGGRALGDGAIGDTIRVLNIQSNVVIEARVESSNMVTVASRQRIALN